MYPNNVETPPGADILIVNERLRLRLHLGRVDFKSWLIKYSIFVGHIV